MMILIVAGGVISLLNIYTLIKERNVMTLRMYAVGGWVCASLWFITEILRRLV